MVCLGRSSSHLADGRGILTPNHPCSRDSRVRRWSRAMARMNEVPRSHLSATISRKCGIATFTHDLHRSIAERYPEVGCCVVRWMISRGLRLSARVRFQVAERFRLVFAGGRLSQLQACHMPNSCCDRRRRHAEVEKVGRRKYGRIVLGDLKANSADVVAPLDIIHRHDAAADSGYRSAIDDEDRA